MVFAFGFLTLLGSDGFLRVPTLTADRAWFMMGGKSWFSGLVPYVDFTDSKGPLLWFLYGAGWLLSPHNFIGVWLVQILFYWATFCMLYLIGRRAGLGRASSLLVPAVMAVFYFTPGLHQETLVEDYCHLFNAVALYVVFAVMVSGNPGRLWYYLLGLCAGAALMLKYSWFLTLLFPAFFIFIMWLSGRKWREAVIFACLWLAGVATVVLPFIFTLAAQGALQAFVQEYFLNTFSTIRGLDAGGGGKRTVALYTAAVAFLLCMGLWRLRGKRFFVSTLAVWFVGSLIPCLMAGPMHPNYFFSLAVFACPGVLVIVSRLRRLTLPGALVGAGCILAALVCVSEFWSYSEFYDVRRARVSRLEMERVAAVINAESRRLGRPPRLAYYHDSEKGEHMLTGAVAGARYWSLQAGMTPEMLEAHERQLLSGAPDLVIVARGEPGGVEKFRALGYRELLQYTPWPEAEGAPGRVYVLLGRIQ